MQIKKRLGSSLNLLPVLAVLAVLLLLSDHRSYRQAGVTMTAAEGAATPREVTVEVLNTTERRLWNAGDSDPGYRLQRRLLGLWFPMRQVKPPGGTVCGMLPTYLYETDVPQKLTFQWSSDYRFPFTSLYPGHYRLILDFREDDENGGTQTFPLAAEFTLE